jgi:hypothetical protein
MAIIALVTERTAAEVEEVQRRAFKPRPKAKQTDSSAEETPAGEVTPSAAQPEDED